MARAECPDGMQTVALGFEMFPRFGIDYRQDLDLSDAGSEIRLAGIAGPSADESGRSSEAQGQTCTGLEHGVGLPPLPN